MHCPRCDQNYASAQLGIGNDDSGGGDIRKLPVPDRKDEGAVECGYCGYTASWEKYEQDIMELQKS